MIKQLGLLLAFFTWISTAQAEKSLGDLASDAGVDWLLGQWERSDNGDAISLSFKAELNNHMVLVSHKDQRLESRGLIFLDPGTTEPKYQTVNDMGGVGTGTWSAEDKKAILKYKLTDSEGKVIKMAFTFKNLDSDSMEVQIFDLSDKDEIGNDARVTTKFQRKK